MILLLMADYPMRNNQRTNKKMDLNMDLNNEKERRQALALFFII